MSVGIQRLRTDGDNVRTGARAKGDDPALVCGFCVGALFQQNVTRNTIHEQVAQLYFRALDEQQPPGAADR